MPDHPPLTLDDATARLRAVFTHLEALARNPTDVVAKKHVRDNSEALRDAMDTVFDNSKDLNAERLAKIRKVVVIPGTPAPAAGPKPAPSEPSAPAESAEPKDVAEDRGLRQDEIDLGTFLKGVAEDMIAAQTDINGRSIRYAEQVKAQFGGLIQPSHFTIPSVRAEMRVGFEKASSSGVNLILLNSATRKTSYGESTVSFDLIAAPAPAGAINLPFVVLGDLHRRLIAAALRIDHADLMKELNVPKTQQFVTIFRIVRQMAGIDGYLFVWVFQDANKDIFDSDWRKLVIFAATERPVGPDAAVELELDATPFREEGVDSDSPPFIVLGTRQQIRKQEAIEKIVDLGDTVMNIVAGVARWATVIGLPEEVIASQP